VECLEIGGEELVPRAETYPTLLERDWKMKVLGMIHHALVLKVMFYSLNENERGSFWNRCGKVFTFNNCFPLLTSHHRSPALEQPPPSHDSGGWGLGAGQIENPRADDEEDEPSDWEQAHVRIFAESTGNEFDADYRLTLGNSDDGPRSLCVCSLIVSSVKYITARHEECQIIINSARDVVSLPNAQEHR